MKPFFRKESLTKETRLFLLRKNKVNIFGAVIANTMKMLATMNENLKNHLIFRLSDHVSIYIHILFY